MCGIAGFCNPRNDFMQTQNKWISILMYGLKLLTY